MNRDPFDALGPLDLEVRPSTDEALRQHLLAGALALLLIASAASAPALAVFAVPLGLVVIGLGEVRFRRRRLELRGPALIATDGLRPFVLDRLDVLDVEAVPASTRGSISSWPRHRILAHLVDGSAREVWSSPASRARWRGVADLAELLDDWCTESPDGTPDADKLRRRLRQVASLHASGRVPASSLWAAMFDDLSAMCADRPLEDAEAEVFEALERWDRRTPDTAYDRSCELRAAARRLAAAPPSHA